MHVKKPSIFPMVLPPFGTVSLSVIPGKKYSAIRTAATTGSIIITSKTIPAAISAFGGTALNLNSFIIIPYS